MAVPFNYTNYMGEVRLNASSSTLAVRSLNNTSHVATTLVPFNICTLSLEESTTMCIGSDAPDCCYPLDSRLSLVAGILCILVAIVGASGNLLTLLALPYARWKGRASDRLWNPTTLFVLNLSFEDLLYCVINLPLYSSQYLHRRWRYTSYLCEAAAFFRYANAASDWMSLATVALTRCLALINPQMCERIFGSPKGFIYIVLVWLYAVSILLPIRFKVFGKFGYNKLAGKCDLVPTGDTDPHMLMYLLSFTLPLAIIVVSYTTIYYTVHRSSKSLAEFGSETTRDQLQTRDMRLTWTILLVCIAYILFVLPITLMNVLDPNATWPNLHLAFFCLYWMQYSVNVFIYAVQNKQYRKAYMFFIWSFVLRRADYSAAVHRNKQGSLLVTLVHKKSCNSPSPTSKSHITKSV